MINSVPYEVIAGPGTFYIADFGATYPLVDAVPDPNDWTKIGSEGDLNYDEEGIDVEHAQEVNHWRALGDAGSRKSFRTAEDLRFGLILVDVTLEQYSFALEHNAVATVAAGVGTVGYKWVGLSRNLDMVARALLIRFEGLSPYGSTWNMQYEVPRAQQVGNPRPVFRKGTPAGLALQWQAQVDPNASTAARRFGRLVAQHAAAGT